MGIFLRRGVAVIIAAVTFPCWASVSPNPKDLVTAELVAQTASVAPGTNLWVDLHLRIKPGWHVYWRNPGRFRAADDDRLASPDGVFGRRNPVASAGAFCRERHRQLRLHRKCRFARSAHRRKAIVPDRSAALAADASWLACADICIPGSAKLSLTMPVTTAPAIPDPATAALFAAVHGELPLPAPFEPRFVVGFRRVPPAGSSKRAGRGTQPNRSLFPPMTDH